MLESEYGGDWEGVSERGVAQSHKAPDGSAEPEGTTRGTGRAADDLLNQQSGATGLRFAPQAVSHSSEALPILDCALADGLQVPLIVGGPNADQRFAHYVLVMQRRESADGVVEYQFRDPGGITHWVSADQIRAQRDAGRLQRDPRRRGADARTTRPPPRPARHPRHQGAGRRADPRPETPPIRSSAPRRPARRSTASRRRSPLPPGTVNKDARDQLVADIKRQVPDVALQEQVAAGARTVVRVIASGIKQMNDDILGPEDRRHAHRQAQRGRPPGVHGSWHGRHRVRLQGRHGDLERRRGAGRRRDGHRSSPTSTPACRCRSAA